MIETNDNPEDVESRLKKAQADLQAFEDGVDRKRLLERLRTQSPMHPVLLFRTACMLLAMLSGLTAIIVMIVPLMSRDLARAMVKFEAVVPAPPGVPGLPALLGVLMLCMGVAWLMATLAAHAMGRDAQMLPWEQKEHQTLVNEVTRLTTQKAVMERIRGTPAGARPRIATPVPMGGRGMTPPGVATYNYGTPAPAPASRGTLGGGLLGGAPGRFGPPPVATPAPAPSAGGGSLLGRARSAGLSHSATPAGLYQEPLQDPAPAFGQRQEPRSGGLGGGFPATEGRGLTSPPLVSSSRDGSPLGAAPRAGRGLGERIGASPTSAQQLAAPVGFPGTPEPSQRHAGPPQGPSPFGTPAPAKYGANGAASHSLLSKARAGRPEGLDLGSPYAARPREPQTAAPTERLNVQTFPRWGPIDEPWLEEAIQRAEQVAATFPEQAHLQFSQETHLPFTLVIARATPAMAVRAMVGFVEFLASVLTPPRARIELQNVPHLDSSFHRNVSAALEPYFGDRFEVEPEIGRVEIIFKDPDPSWQDVPVLPME